MLNAYLWVKFSVAKEKQIFHEKKNMQQLPKTQFVFLSNKHQIIIQNNLDTVYTLYMVQNYQF